MGIYVYITDQCLKDAKKHSYQEQVERFKDQIEALQSLSRFDHFPIPYLKKRFERAIRLVASSKKYKINDNEEILVIFWRLFVRGDTSGDGYSSFLKDPKGFGEKYFTDLVTEDTLESYLRSRVAQTPVKLMEKPSDVEYEYLYVVKGNHDEHTTEEKICESERWVQSISANEYKYYLANICGNLLRLSHKPDDFIWKDPERNLYIVYRVLPSLKIKFLAGLAKNKNDCDQIINSYPDIFQDSTEPDLETVLRHSFRAYPELLTVDENIWMGIQEDKEANLSLSPEETKLLDCVHHGRQSNQGYPLFINGRAGSGKSTILYFLFSDYVGHYLSLRKNHKDAPQPILLSCSSELVERATQSVTNILSSHYKRKIAGQVLDDSDKDIITRCFAMFHSFLHQEMAKDLRERFNHECYIDYSKFRRLWDVRFGQQTAMQKKGADLCWHVIRTYIKGTNPEEYLEPEDYQSLPSKQKTVSYETYDFVFKRVWDAWYRDLTASNSSTYWDDQDLVRAIIEKDDFSSKYAVVFCDEAQDFTRIELELIYRLSLFTMRRLIPQEEIPRLPFAFAGDPFQTINPTGFRWDAVKATFHEKLVDSLRLSPDIDVPFNYQELNHNYRSTKNIVRLCNAFQLFRAAAFDIPYLLPQVAWHAEQNSPVPVWFDRDNPSLWQNYLANESDITIIVPCLMGEEGDYVSKDPFLSKIVNCDDTGTPKNVLSPARAKGLEFNRVVLYSFGISAPDGLINFLNRNATSDSIDEHLEYEYFLNRVYVAASRPKRRLFIIDTDEGRRKLWDIVLNEDIHQNCFQKLGDKAMDAWINYIGGYQQGTTDSWAEGRGNTEENAEMYEQRGLLSQDPFLLRSAALSYESLSNKQKSLSCKAQAFRIECKYEKAARHFAEANDIDMSIACCWEGMLRKSILELAKQFPIVMERLEYKFLYISENPDILSLSDLLGEIVGMVESSKQFQVRLVREGTWGKLLSQCIEKIKGSQVEWEGITILTEKLISKGLRMDIRSQAIMYYNSARYNEALKICENNKGDKKIENIYWESQKQITLIYYREGKIDKISKQGWELVAEDMIEQMQYKEAFECLQQTGDESVFIRQANKFPIDNPMMKKVVINSLKKYDKEGQWDRIIQFASYALLQKQTPDNHILLFAKKHKKYAETLFVWLCAFSSTLTEQRNDIKELVQSLIKKALDSYLVSIRKYIPLDIAGMAMEKSGYLYKDILTFYDKAIEQNDGFEDEILFAKVHWIIVQERYADYEEKNNRIITARKRREHIESRRQAWGLSSEIEKRFIQLTKSFDDVLVIKDIDEITTNPDSPQVKPLPETVHTTNDTEPLTLSDTTEEEQPIIPPEEPLKSVLSSDIKTKKNYKIKIEDLMIEYSPTHNRINITDTNDRTASIFIDKKEFRSIDFVIEIIEDKSFCREWDIEVLFSDSESKIIFIDIGITLTFLNRK